MFIWFRCAFCGDLLVDLFQSRSGFTYGRVETLTRWKDPNVCLSVVSVNPLNAIRMRISYPARLHKIWHSNEKFFVSTCGVVVIDLQHGIRTKVESVDVQGVHQLWDRDSLGGSCGTSQRFYVDGSFLDLLPNVQLVIPPVSIRGE